MEVASRICASDDFVAESGLLPTYVMWSGRGCERVCVCGGRFVSDEGGQAEEGCFASGGETSARFGKERGPEQRRRQRVSGAGRAHTRRLLKWRG
eukprot:4404946-Pleurochrysis_carterae.AAC.1